MRGSAGHVFISYARDGAEGERFARRVHERLTSSGHPCWLDVESGLPEERWDDAIPAAIRAAGLVACVLNRAALDDRRWVRDEWLLARDEDVPRIFLRVEPGVDPPFGHRRLNPIDFTADEPAAWERLERRVRAHLDTLDAPEADVEAAYLDALLADTGDYRRAERLYVALRAETLRVDTLRHVLARSHMPVTMRYESRDEERADELPGGPPRPGREPRLVGDALVALRESRRLVVLGEPGAGKTFTLERLCADLAEVARERDGAPIPVFVRLGQWIEPGRSFAALLAASARLLGPHLPRLLAAKRLALILDGLNEIPTAQREDKGEAIARWLGEHDEGLAYVVASCRRDDFLGPLRLELDRLVIRDLDPPRVHEFVHRYLGALDEARGEAPDAQKADALFWHLAGGAPVRDVWRHWCEAGIGDLEAFWTAREPPALPAAALDRWLPWRRSRLTWLQSRLEQIDDSRRRAIEDERSLLRLASRPYMLTMIVELHLRHGLGILAGNRADLFARIVADHLARENEAHRRKDGADHPARADLEAALGRLAWEMQASAGGPESVQVALSRGRASALLPEGGSELARDADLLTLGETVAFTHQLLQEYFVRIGMRDRMVAGTLRAEQLWPPERWWAPSGWEQAAVLMAGLGAAEGEASGEPWAARIVQWLGDAQPLVLARCVRESGMGDLPEEVLAALKERWLRRLDPEVEPEPEGRHAVATALAWLGLDDRPGVGLREDGLPDIDWVEVPAGPFIYQHGERRELLGYWLSRYPVTNAQYEAFVRAGGYEEERWWRGLARRIDQPVKPRWAEVNRPRARVSWYEAVAYCRWLSEAVGYEVRLPREDEWEKGARGEDGREYPWGEAYRVGHANVDERSWHDGPYNIGETTAVGLYPHGASPYGLLDMSGNVREWCLNAHEHPAGMSEEGYECHDSRGGSWSLRSEAARASVPYRDGPACWSVDIGFRLLSSSPKLRR